MAKPYNRSLSLALRRLRTVVFLAALTLGIAHSVHLVVWSLASFTDLRFNDDAPGGKKDKSVVRGRDRENRFVSERRRRRREAEEQPTEETRAMSGVDGIFAMTIDSTRAAGLLAALVVCPLIGLGIILSVTGGAVRIERAVTALTIAMILVALALPLGGWLGIGWGEGTLSSYAALVTEVDEARAMEGFPLRFYARFLLLPVIAAIGFLLVHLKFAGALEGILLAAGLEGIDPTLELEASNVKATSLHAGGQAGHALKRVLKDGKPRAKRKKRRVSPNPAGDLPQRLI